VNNVINLVVALDCEARPLIERFDLKRQPEHAYPLYTSEQMQLIVSGVGKLNSAIATGYLAGLSDEPAAWLNIGIAGHMTHPLGELYLCHKITDMQTGQSSYPAFTFKTTLPTASLDSFDVPVNEYHDDLLHDMEASGFYQAASRFATVEFIHCLKVISDNQDSPTHNINKQMVSELIANTIVVIADFINLLSEQHHRWLTVTATPDSYHEIIQKWHFSTYQQHQLKQLIKRWATHYPGASPLTAELLALKNSRDVLAHMQAALNIEQQA
jgi:nucleoside phosphorylase